MTPARFAQLGELLFGPAWVGALAEALEVAERTARRWKSGHSPIPEGVGADIAALCRRRATVLVRAAEALEKT